MSSVVKFKRKIHVPKAEKTFREQVVSLVGGAMLSINFDDTKPNHLVILNMTTSPIYVGRSYNVGSNNYDYIVAPGTRFQCIFSSGLSSINLLCASSGTCIFNSYEAELTPEAMGMANVGGSVSINGSLPYQTLVERSYTEADAVAGIVTFSKVISCIEIYNRDTVNTGTFLVNGFLIVVPKSETWTGVIGGTPSKQVTISGSTSYILNRFE